MSWHYEDGMVVVTAVVPAERGALVIQALQKVVDPRTDERDAYYQSLLAGERGPVPVAADAELADFEFVAETTEPEPVAHKEVNGSGNGSGRAAATADGQHPNGTVTAEPAMTADDPGDVSAETQRPAADDFAIDSAAARDTGAGRWARVGST